MTRKRGRRCRKLLDDLKDRRGNSHLKEEALDRTMWRNRFRGGFGPVVRQNTEWMNISLMYELKKFGKVFTSKFVGTGPSFYKKIIYRAAV